MTVKDLILSALCDVYINTALDGNGDMFSPHVCIKAHCDGYADDILNEKLLNREVCLIGVKDDAMYIELSLEEEGE